MPPTLDVSAISSKGSSAPKASAASATGEAGEENRFSDALAGQMDSQSRKNDTSTTHVEQNKAAKSASETKETETAEAKSTDAEPASSAAKTDAQQADSGQNGKDLPSEDGKKQAASLDITEETVVFLPAGLELAVKEDKLPTGISLIQARMQTESISTSEETGASESVKGDGKRAQTPGLYLSQQATSQQAMKAEETTANANATIKAQQLQTNLTATAKAESAASNEELVQMTKDKKLLDSNLQLTQTSDKPTITTALKAGQLTVDGQAQREFGRILNGNLIEGSRAAANARIGEMAMNTENRQNLFQPVLQASGAMMNGMSSGEGQGSLPLNASGLPSSSVQTPVGNAQWGQAMGQRLQMMVSQQVQQAEIKLNPRNMGPVEVRINLSQDQATVSFVASHPQTREALEASMPRLKEMLGESGLNLVDVNVSDQSNREQTAHSQGQDERFERGGASFDSSFATQESDEDANTAGINEPRWYGSNNVFDTYV